MTVTRIVTRRLTRARQLRHLVTRGQAGPTGPQGPAGTALAIAHHAVSATAARGTLNVIDADNVVLTLPAGAVDGEPIQFLVPQARTGFAINGGAATVNGAAGDEPFPDGPCSGTLVYIAAETNWFLFLVNTGQTPA